MSHDADGRARGAPFGTRLSRVGVPPRMSPGRPDPSRPEAEHAYVHAAAEPVRGLGGALPGELPVALLLAKLLARMVTRP